MTLFSIGSLNTAMCKSGAPVSNNLVAVLNFLIFTNREAAEGECKIEKNAQANNSMLSLGASLPQLLGQNPAAQIIPWQ